MTGAPAAAGTPPGPVPKWRLISDGNEDGTDGEQRDSERDVGSSRSSATRPFVTCTLPPHFEAISFSSVIEFERHYQTYHAFRCTLPPVRADWTSTAPSALPRASNGGARTTRARRQCDKTFPSDHFLQLHIEECHSALARERQERGEKIFACFLSDACTRHFATPKQRRRHLIDAHGFSNGFFFSLPVHGTGELEERYGEGASLIRREWRPRGRGRSAEGVEMLEDENEGDSTDEEAQDRKLGTATAAATTAAANAGRDDGEGRRTRKRKETSPDTDSSLPSSPSYSAQPLPQWARPPPLGPGQVAETAAVSDASRRRQTLGPPAKREDARLSGSEALVEALSSLSLVPPSVRMRSKRLAKGQGPKDVDQPIEEDDGGLKEA